MRNNTFGTTFSFTSWGESHGKEIGVVVDGCPAGLALSEEDFLQDMERRQGGSPLTTPRKEPDTVHIRSGVFEGKTTGAPIALVIENTDAQPSTYHANIHKPGHASYTYMHKYGIFDYRGSGRASARETACRVAVGVVAKKLLLHFGVTIQGTLAQVGKHEAPCVEPLVEAPLFCPDNSARKQFEQALQQAIKQGDSLGGIVECHIYNTPIGLGDPIYNKLEAHLAYAMLSIPASKGFEIGEGFAAAQMNGSQHNDEMGKSGLASNNCGGTLGGISTGTTIRFRVPFKPTSSIKKEQATTTYDGAKTTLTLKKGSRHDPCVAIRAVPVVESMAAITLADALLRNRTSTLEIQQHKAPSQQATSQQPQLPA